MSNVLTAAEATKIKRGLKLLDTYKPNWFTSMNRDNFNLGSDEFCVLGSVYSDYLLGLQELASEAIDKVITDSGLRLAERPDGGELDGPYYGFVPGNNASNERMGQTWLHAADLRKARAARRRKAAKNG